MAKPSSSPPRVGKATLDLLADLIGINSVNPNYDGGVPEQAIAAFVENFFRERGIEVASHDVLPNRPNVIARIPGRNRQRRIIFEAHLDTVSAAGMAIDPFEPIVRDGKMFGRGACDTKGGMAAMMAALASLAADGITPACDVDFVATIDEEYSYRGVVDYCQGLTADAAIIAEPTSLQAVIASKGLVRWKIETRGVSAHSAKPQLGINAIEHMAHIIAALATDSQRLVDSPHRLLGPATCSIGVIRGGTQINLVPDRCEIEIDRRILPHETIDSVLDHYQRLVDGVAADVEGMRVIMHPPLLTDVPLETAADAPAVHTMTSVLTDLGLDATLTGVPFCSDASKFGAIGIPSMILGPGSIDQAHAAVEYIECEQVIQATEIYRRYMLDFQ